MYSTDWAEDVAADEEARFTRIAETLQAVQKGRNERYGEQARTLHRKAHAGVAATLDVRADLASVLPSELHVGPFQPGSSYAGFVRFSNGGFDRAPKDVPDVRGVAIKLLGVTGPKALGEADTQDFLLNFGSKQATKSPDEFIALVDAASKGGPLGTFFRMGGAIGYGRALAILKATVAAFGLPFRGYASEAFNTMVPYRFGATAARFGLLAIDGRPQSGPTLAADLAARLKDGASWTFRVQLYQDTTRTPIEDATVDWDSPWLDVGTLRVPPVDIASEAAQKVAAYVEKLAFDPWHAHELLRPVGAFNRARKVAYFLGSAQHRETIPDAEVRPAP